MKNLITVFVIIFVAITIIPVIKNNSDVNHDTTDTFTAVGDGTTVNEVVTLTYVTVDALVTGDVLVNGVSITQGTDFIESGTKDVTIYPAAYNTGDEIVISYVYELNTYGDSRVFVDLIPLFLALGLLSIIGFRLIKSKSN